MKNLLLSIFTLVTLFSSAQLAERSYFFQGEMLEVIDEEINFLLLKSAKATDTIVLSGGSFTPAIYDKYGDSIVFNCNNILLTKTIDRKEIYSIYNKQLKKKIKNFLLFGFNNGLFWGATKGEYYELDFNFRKTKREFHGVCGTVAHYTLAIQETQTEFIVTQDETFFDQSNSEKPKRVVGISKDKVDSLYFSNTYKEFRYDANDSFRIKYLKLIGVKSGKYFAINNPFSIFDWNQFLTYDFMYRKDYITVTVRDNKFGILNIVEPKYKQIIIGEIIKIQFEDGGYGYLDRAGNEYR